MKINIVVPKLFSDSFSAGIFVILKHANALAERGHQVNVIPYMGSASPEWIELKAKLILDDGPSAIKRVLSKMGLGRAAYKSKDVQSALNKQSIIDRIPNADITIATLWETADIVSDHGSGVGVYFMQSFESGFYELGSPEHRGALSSYQLPLHQIANSTWLKRMVTEYQSLHGFKQDISLVVNGIDHEVFKPVVSPNVKRSDNHLIIISYGGRGAELKGFRSMAEAVKRVRAELPQYSIEWHVFGQCELPPENEIAPYKALGFLSQPELADALSEADICLSASRFESFPMFPLEAMCCGAAVVASDVGADDYLLHEKTAEVIDPNDLQSISNGLSRLIVNREYREKLINEALLMARNFSWSSSFDAFEETLFKVRGKSISRTLLVKPSDNLQSFI